MARRSLLKTFVCVDTDRFPIYLFGILLHLAQAKQRSRDQSRTRSRPLLELTICFMLAFVESKEKIAAGRHSEAQIFPAQRQEYRITGWRAHYKPCGDASAAAAASAAASSSLGEKDNFASQLEPEPECDQVAAWHCRSARRYSLMMLLLLEAHGADDDDGGDDDARNVISDPQASPVPQLGAPPATWRHWA